MKYLLDTGVISEPVSPRPDAGVARWMSEREDSSFYLSVITLGEIHKGIERLANGRRKRALLDWADETLFQRFEGRILIVDAEVASEWGRLQAKALNSGRPVPVVDSLLAATAIVHHLTVVTRNTADFETCGVDIHNPWSA